MSNISHLLQRYRDTAQADIISRALDSAVNTPKRIQLSGLSGAQRAFVAAAVAQKKNGFCQVFIAESKEEAAYLHNDLESLLSGQTVFFFPDSFKRPAFFDEINPTQVLQRSEVVSKAVGTGGSLPVVRTDGRKADTPASLIVTYPEALFEKVVNPNVLAETRIRIAAGERLDVDFVIEVLIEYGFERTDFVYEPGQFSIRGGIVDLFSWGNELPYRIELFDDEVESMRTFNPESQLSERKISELTIIPNIQNHFVQELQSSLFEFLPENTIFWMEDMPLFKELIEKQEQRALEEYEQLAKSKTKEHPFLNKQFSQLFLNSNDLVLQLSHYRIITQPPLIPLLLKDENGSSLLQVDIRPQPSFGRNFDLLIQDIQALQKEKYQVFLCSENARQLERFHHIFQDKQAQISFHPIYQAFTSGFIDKDLKIALYTDHQIFERYHKYKTKSGFNRNKALSIRHLKDLNPGDYVTHIDHGVGVFSGLQKLTINGKEQEMVRLIYKDEDVLYVNINSLHKIAKYTGKEGHAPKINKLGSDVWTNLKNKTKKKVKDIAAELIKLYAMRKVQPGFAFNKDTYLQDELEASFMYEDTPDQYKATLDVKADMEKPHPMDRLICGDVGFGKTEVAIRAAFKAVTDGKQVAVLVPTTILAWQHYKTFSSRLNEFGVTVDYLNRFKSAKEKKETLQKAKDKKVDIVIGTHAILSKDLEFKDLGLLIIDEEQKFGVSAKEKLRQLALNIDTLTLTATPIPRTLKFSLMGARDLSNIMTPPTNRIPVSTEVHAFDIKFIKEAIEFEVYRGGQVYFVHNRVKDIHEIEILLKKMMPDISVATAHGQLEGDKLEEIMLGFINGEYDVLLSTNIIESGLDIPNANTILIHNAHQFGLSDLHQLRGRVGRGADQSYCILMAGIKLSSDSKQRLQAMVSTNDGFEIANIDLRLRGPGDIQGTRQSGVLDLNLPLTPQHKIDVGVAVGVEVHRRSGQVRQSGQTEDAAPHPQGDHAGAARSKSAGTGVITTKSDPVGVTPNQAVVNDQRARTRVSPHGPVAL